MIESFNNTEPKYLVNSLHKAIRILKKIAWSEKSEMGVSELSTSLEVGKSTVHRLLSTLEYHGLVEKNEETQKYRLGWTLFRMGHEVLLPKILISVFRPYLKELRDLTGETVNLAIKGDNCVIIIDKAVPDDVLKASLDIGQKEPLHATALGKIVLANLSDEELIKQYSDVNFKKYTHNTKTRLEELLGELKTVRREGIAYDREEMCEGLKCLSAGVKDNKGDLVAAIS
ncbi:MAG: IclR family transcriptional regulator, partial [Candidatus Odinarchaeia archaeon]